MMERKIRRGEIYIADLDPVVGSEQGGERPVLVIQNNVGNTHSPTVIVLAITSRCQKKKYMPTHIPIESSDLSRAAGDARYFTMCVSTLFHIHRQVNISLNIL